MGNVGKLQAVEGALQASEAQWAYTCAACRARGEVALIVCADSTDRGRHLANESGCWGVNSGRMPKLCAGRNAPQACGTNRISGCQHDGD